MVNDNPNLIPPPSIGESAPAQSAPIEAPRGKGSKLWILVVICMVVGIALGIFVYQESIAPAPKPSPRPTTPSVRVSPTPSPAANEINQVTPQSLNVTFPKAGEVRVYFSTYDAANPVILNQLIRLEGTNKSADLLVPGSLPAGNKMAVINSGLSVAAGESLKLQVYDNGNETRPGTGWIKPDAANKCGATTKANAAPLIEWATAQSSGQPLVSIQCWGDWGTEEDKDYNDYLVVVSYNPTTATAPSPSPVASVVASPSPLRSPSPSPSVAAIASPSPSPLRSPSPSPVVYDDEEEEDVVVDPSPRVTMPEGSSLPDAGILEVTVGTVGIGLVFVLLGVVGLLLI